jgi:hypothetical protein
MKEKVRNSPEQGPIGALPPLYILRGVNFIRDILEDECGAEALPVRVLLGVDTDFEPDVLTVLALQTEPVDDPRAGAIEHLPELSPRDAQTLNVERVFEETAAFDIELPSEFA